MTQEELKQILHYNPDTGIFTWLINANNNGALKGSAAGTISDAGYNRITRKRKHYGAHRLAWLYMYGASPLYEIDHINHLRDDNRIENLRVATRTEQSQNTTLSRNSTSGIQGVYYKKSQSVWVAHIRVKGDKIYLGSSKSLKEAGKIRKEAEVKYGFHENHGKAKTCKPD